MKHTILVVEDEGLIAADIRGKLEKASYVVPNIVDNAADALLEVERLRPSLVLMDIRLKGPRDGIEAAREIRRQFGTPVIFVTAHTDQQTLDRAALAQPCGYVVKPLRDSQLCATVQMALRTQQDQRERPAGARDPRVGGRNNDFLAGGGEMGKFIAAKNWAETPLGAIEDWPQDLRTTVSLCVASNFPISLIWGPDRTQIYNDGYWPICGAKHPSSMGQDFRQCWASAWPVIGAAFEAAERGEARFLENQRMFLDRNGYLEETFFTFSFSPIQGETQIHGLFHPVTETTARMLSERRTRALRDIAHRTQNSTSVAMACAATREALEGYPLDVPFALIYLADGPNGELRLAASAGIAADEGGISPSWLAEGGPVPAAMSGGTPQIVTDPCRHLGVSAAGPYPEAPSQALVVPIAGTGGERYAGALIAGISSRLPLETAYRNFVDLLASQVGTAIATGRTYESERARAEALSALDKAKTAFFSNVSHEFRTPLTLMLGPLEDMLGEPGETVNAARDELELVLRNAERLLRLVNTLLDFSRVEAGRADAVFEPVDLASFTADIASSFRAAAEKTGLRLVVDCAPLSEPVFVDPALWETIVLNLLSNAFKFTLEGEIRVVVLESGGEAKLRVEDTGTGIAAEELPRLFERFYRVAESRGRTIEGSGIGLSLVRELVKLHGGRVGAESEITAGTTFTVSLPFGCAHLPSERVRPPDPASPRPPSSAMRRRSFVDEFRGRPGETPLQVPARSHAEEGGSARQRPRVLLADDNADMRGYIERLLAGEFDVRSVSNGVEALQAARSDPPDLVISDVMMPELDGFGLLAALRKDPRTNRVPVVLLSARAGDEARTEGIGAGADDYLVKPFAARELLARVRARIELTQLRSQLHEQEVISRSAAAREQQWRLFDTALSHTPDHVFIFDHEHRFLYANHALISLWHKSATEWIGRTMTDLELPVDMVAKVDAHLTEVNDSKQAVRSEVMLLDPDQNQRTYEYILTPVLSASGAVEAFAGTSRETTERKKMEERLQIVVEAAPSAMVMIGTDGRIVLINTETERLFGYDRAALLGSSIEMLLPARYRSEHSGHRNGFVAERAARPMGAGRELLGLRSDGTEVPVEVGLSPITTAEGKFTLASVTDVTERHRAHRERESLIARLKAALSEKIVLLQEVHHRVKNNLAVISGLLGMQSDAVADERTKSAFEESQHRVLSMALIHEFLYSSDSLDRVAFGQYIQQLTGDLVAAYSTGPRRIVLEVEAEEIELPVHLAIPCGLILNELVSNALKHAYPGGQKGVISIRFRRGDAGRLSLSCTDRGVGIPESLDWQKASSLGLRVTQILTKQLDGTLTLDRTGGGTHFELTFPESSADQSAYRSIPVRNAPDAESITAGR